MIALTQLMQLQETLKNNSSHRAAPKLIQPNHTGVQEGYISGGSKIERHKQPIAQETNFAQNGNITDFSKTNSPNFNGNELIKQCFTQVKICPKCLKPNAFTMTICNKCADSVPITQVIPTPTENFLVGAMYGVESVCRGVGANTLSSPNTLSIRSQSNNILVCDDLLSLSPCHLLAVPMSRHIADWRYLLLCPSFGLRILEDLETSAWKCAEATMQTDLYMSQFIGTPHAPVTKADLLMGLNFPPSVSQLHLQCILAPMLPFEYNLLMKGQHFTINRFFPLEYVKRVLSIGERMEVNNDTTIEHIIEHFRGRVNYEDMHNAFIAQVHERQQIRGVWDSRIFKGTFPIAGEPPSSTFNEDKTKLMNWGTNGTTYYKYPKKETVPSWLTDGGVAADAHAQLSAQYDLTYKIAPFDTIRIHPIHSIGRWAHTQLQTQSPEQSALTYNILMNIAMCSNRSDLVIDSCALSEQIMQLFKILWACSDQNPDIGCIKMGVTYNPTQMKQWKGRFPFLIPVGLLASLTTVNGTHVTWKNADKDSHSLKQQVSLTNGVIKVEFRENGFLKIGEKHDFVDNNHGPYEISDTYLKTLTTDVGNNGLQSYWNECRSKWMAEMGKTDGAGRKKVVKSEFQNLLDVIDLYGQTNKTHFMTQHECSAILEYGLPVRCASIIENHTHLKHKALQDKFPEYLKTSGEWGLPLKLQRLSLCESATQLHTAIKNITIEERGTSEKNFEQMEWSRTGDIGDGMERGVVITLQGVRTDGVHHIWTSSQKKKKSDSAFYTEANVKSLHWPIAALATDRTEAERLVGVLLSLGAK